MKVTIQKHLSNTEQLPKNPVYDVKWLAKILYDYWVWYTIEPASMPIVLSAPSKMPIDPKTSADIIIAAVAKELNEGWECSGTYFSISIDEKVKEYTGVELSDCFDMYHGQVKFKDLAAAQKAINILNGIEPQILKNYFP